MVLSYLVHTFYIQTLPNPYPEGLNLVNGLPNRALFIQKLLRKFAEALTLVCEVGRSLR